MNKEISIVYFVFYFFYQAYKIPGHLGQIGFITSMSEHFCGGNFIKIIIRLSFVWLTNPD